MKEHLQSQYKQSLRLGGHRERCLCFYHMEVVEIYQRGLCGIETYHFTNLERREHLEKSLA